MHIGMSLFNDGTVTSTHLSLFIVTICGEYDAILKWPFNYKISFHLYDQSSAEQHITHFIDPNTQLNHFQQPSSRLNIASSIPKFCSSERIFNKNSCYVQNDTMFIKVMINSFQIPDSLQQYVLGLNPGIPALQRLRMVQAEIDRLHSEAKNTIR